MRYTTNQIFFFRHLYPPSFLYCLLQVASSAFSETCKNKKWKKLWKRMQQEIHDRHDAIASTKKLAIHTWSTSYQLIKGIMKSSLEMKWQWGHVLLGAVLKDFTAALQTVATALSWAKSLEAPWIASSSLMSSKTSAYFPAAINCPTWDNPASIVTNSHKEPSRTSNWGLFSISKLLNN